MVLPFVKGEWTLWGLGMLGVCVFSTGLVGLEWLVGSNWTCKWIYVYVYIEVGLVVTVTVDEILMQQRDKTNTAAIRERSGDWDKEIHHR